MSVNTIKFLLVLITLVTVSCNRGASVVDTSLLPKMTIENIQGIEGTVIKVPVRLSAPANETVTIDYSTLESTAKGDVDFTSKAGELIIPVGDDSGFIEIMTTDDTLSENLETFQVVIAKVDNALVSSSEITVNLLDNDALPNLTVADVTITEGDNSTIQFSLSTPAGRDVSIDMETQNITATSDVDFGSLTRSEFVIPEGQTTATISVPSIDDLTDEIDETFKLVITGAENVNVIDNTGIITITDNDNQPTISIADSSVIEGATASYIVSLSAVSGKDITFNWSTTAGTALAPADFFSGSGNSISLPAGVSSVEIFVTTVDDTLTEVSENYTVNISSPVNATIGNPTANTTLIDNDVIPTVSIGDATAVEGGAINVPVTLSAVSGLTVQVNYSSANLTALSGSDYTAVSGTLTIPAGSSSGNIVVSTTDDLQDEADETFAVTISTPVNSTLGTVTATGTIQDNDSAPALSVNDVTITEGGTATFTVSLSVASQRDITFDWVTQNNTAISASDYNSNSGSVTIPAGTTTTSLVITSIQDSSFELTEDFRVVLSNVGNATLADNTGIATINDNDTAPAISIDDVTLVEGTTAALTVTLTGATSVVTTVNWATVNGTATAPADFAVGSGTLSFAVGETTKTINVVTVDDAIDEANQLLTISLTAPVNATVSDATGQVTIQDNDASPTISVADTTVTEGGSVGFLISLNAASEQTVTVDYASLNGTAVSGSDYTAVSGTATVAAGATSTTVNVVTIDDAISEISEVFTLELSNATNGTISDSSAAVTITDNEVAPTISVNDVTVTEGGLVTFTITANRVSSQNVTVDYAAANNTALVVNDYLAATGTATITAGSTTTTISVSTVDDGIYEVSESFNIVLSNPVNAAISDGTGVATITDNDPQVSISIDDVTNTEGNSITFTVSLSSASGASTSVNWATANSTALAPGDYTNTSGTVVIPAGSTTGTFIVATVSDVTDENDETFLVNLSGATNGVIADAQGVATITDDDNPPTLSVSDPVITEGSNAVFTVTLSAASAKNVTFSYATSDGTAITPEDYTAASSTGSITAGSTSTTVTITTIDDPKDENNGEAFDLTISAPINATIADATGSVSLSDNDTAALSINDVSATESGNLVFTITSDRASVNTITVNWATAPGSAAATSDYTADSGTATITPGNLTTTVTVTTVENTAYEIAELLTVNLTSPNNATVSDAAGTGTINDNDTAPTLVINDVTTTEGGNLNFTVTLTGDSEAAASMTYTASSGSAVLATDFPATTGTLTIPAGSTTGSIVVSTLEDVLNESDETMNITLTAPSNSTFVDNVGVGTISDNDGFPLINVADVTVAEAAVATFTVTLSAVAGRTVTVDWATSNTTATAGSDYTAGTGTLTFLAGETSKTFTVSTIDDANICEGVETYGITLSNAVNGTIGSGTATGSITDNDPSLSIAPVTVTEGTTAGFVVTMSAACSSDVNFDYTTANVTAAAGSDYTTTTGTATITTGNTSFTVNVPTDDDVSPEISETMTVTISNPVNAIITTAAATGTINDNDSIPNITIDDPSITEGGSLVFNVNLSAAAGSNITMNYATSNGTATTADSDYTNTSGVLTITAGATSGTITVLTGTDTKDELDETVNVTISSANFGNITDSAGVGTIVDNDATPGMTINDPTAGENGTLTFTVNLNRASYQDITFDYTTTDGTAIQPGDYSSTSGTGVIIPSGTTTMNIIVTPIDDAVWEASETMNLVLSNVVNANLIDSTGVGTITENDSTPTIAINDVSVAEGGTATFTVTLNKLASSDVTFNWASSNGTATTAGLDYNSASGTAATITAGTLTTTFDVVTLEDSVFEVSETFNITLSGATLATISDAIGVGTITDNDTQPTLSIDDPVKVTEGTAVVFTVTLSAASGSSTNVNWATSSGTATSGSDFTAASGTLTIPAGSTTGSITVTTLNDSVVDVSDESFTVTLSVPVNATITDAAGAGTIGDNEPARLNQALVSGGQVISYGVTTDGAKAVYISDADSNDVFELYSVNSDGTNRVKVNSALVSGGDVTQFALSADNSKIVYLADGSTDEVFELYSVNFDGSSPTKISAAMVSGGDVTSFSISQSSSKVVYLADKDVDTMDELFSVDIGGGTSTQVSDTLIAAGDVTLFRISADSNRVVYLADRDVDEDIEIFSASISGGASTQLNSTLVASGDITSFLISPDSASVVFIGDMELDASTEIYSVSITGGSVNALNGSFPVGGNVSSFKILPDSSKVIYIADADVNDENEIYSVNMNGTSILQLNSALPTGGDIFDFEVSANSGRVVARGDATSDEVYELYSVTPAGASWTKISGTMVSGGDLISYSLSADSARAIYIADQATDEVYELYSTPISSASATKLNSTLPSGGDVSSFLISGNSSKVAFRADATTNDIFEAYTVGITGAGLTKVSATMPSGGNVSSILLSNDSSKLLYLGDQITDTINELFGTGL